jgi:hypothetical protein
MVGTGNIEQHRFDGQSHVMQPACSQAAKGHIPDAHQNSDVHAGQLATGLPSKPFIGTADQCDARFRHGINPLWFTKKAGSLQDPAFKIRDLDRLSGHIDAGVASEMLIRFFALEIMFAGIHVAPISFVITFHVAFFSVFSHYSPL